MQNSDRFFREFHKFMRKWPKDFSPGYARILVMEAICLTFESSSSHIDASIKTTQLMSESLQFYKDVHLSESDD